MFDQNNDAGPKGSVTAPPLIRRCRRW